MILTIRDALMARGGGQVHVLGSDRTPFGLPIPHLFAAELKTVVGHPDREANRTTFVYGDDSLHVTKNIVLESDTSIVLQCGSTQIQITPDGITLTGSTVTLQAASKLVANGRVRRSRSMVTLRSWEPKSPRRRQARPSPSDAKLIGAQVQLGSGKGACGSSPSAGKNPAQKLAPSYLRTKILRGGKPAAGVPYQLVLDGTTTLSGATNAQGIVEQQVPATVATAELTLLDTKQKRTFAIGRIEPIDATLSVQQRLKRLGYYHGPLDGSARAPFAHAVAAFQKARGLPSSGQVDGATAAAIKQEYGS